MQAKSLQPRCCPHCGNSMSNMTKCIFSDAYFCKRCRTSTPTHLLRSSMEYTSPSHWANHMPVVNLDKMEYDKLPPSERCVFDHVKQRPVNPHSGKAEIRQSLKVYKRG